MATNELQDIITRIFYEIEEKTSNDSAQALGVATLCEVLLRENFANYRLLVAEILLNRLYLIRCKKPSPDTTQVEQQLLRAILKLIDLLTDDDFKSFYDHIIGNNRFLAEIFSLINWANNSASNRIQQLSIYLNNVKAQIIQNREDIYQKDVYRYQNGLFMITEKNYLVKIYEFMKDKDCLLLEILDLIKIFIPLNGYGYTIDEKDYNNLEQSGILKELEKCKDCSLKMFIKAAIEGCGKTGNLRFIKTEREDYSRLIEDFWRS